MGTRQPATGGAARAEHATAGSVSFKDLERQSWTAKASAYDTWVGSITAGAIEPLLDAAQVSVGMRMLDVACGPGYAAVRRQPAAPPRSVSISPAR